VGEPPQRGRKVKTEVDGLRVRGWELDRAAEAALVFRVGWRVASGHMEIRMQLTGGSL